MIIKPVCKKEYVLVPNSLLNDTRLTIETRAMLAHLLSKPKNWKIRPIPLAKALSRLGERSLGRKKLDRMFREASEAGYMARSAKQTHQDDGSWGSYDYIVGMPDEVAASVQQSGGAFTFALPQCREAHTPEACTRKDNANHKVQNHKSQKDINPPLKLPPDAASAPQVCQGELGECGTEARETGCFVWEGSKPMQAWERYWRANGVAVYPPLVYETLAGKRIRGAWLPTLYPPGYGASNSGDSASTVAVGIGFRSADATSADTASTEKGCANALINMIMTTQECSRDEAVKIFASLPDAERASDRSGKQGGTGLRLRRKV